MPDEYPRPVSPPAAGLSRVTAGLIGRGLERSLSPRLHGEAARRLGLELEFHCVEAGGDEDWPRLLRRLHLEGWRGASVTMPAKRAVLPHLIGLSPDAIACGSVNLLLRSEEGWIGDNTDGEGFVGPLAARRLVFSSALLIGAGGAARAALRAMVSMPFVGQILLRARSRVAAESLAEEFATEGRELRVLDWDERPGAVELVVNATPLGMAGHEGGALACPAELLGPGVTVFDFVYTPSPTPLLQAAAARGAALIDGREMLACQARRAFEAWTGRRFPLAELLPWLLTQEAPCSAG
jgi:shikimate dehydrogenase